MASLDPNLIIALGTLVGTLGGWLYHKARGDKQASFADQARALIDQVLHVVITTVDANLEEARAKASGAVWAGFDRLGIPRSLALEAMVNKEIELGIARAMQAARDHDRYVQGEMAKAQASLKASLTGWDDVFKRLDEVVKTAPAAAPVVISADVEGLK